MALGEIPLALRQAIIATEDASFYRNPGVDLRAVARALWANLRSGEIVSGGSTITQQVARNLLMAPDERTERTWQRKVREAWLAYALTRSLSKDEILTLYLNETYFGNMAYGVEAAARRYFAKPAAQLDLAECALLAGLPQSPGGYDPLTQPEAAKARQRVVLDLMVQAGYVDAAAADRAYREDLAYAGEPFAIEAPHFCMLVRQQLAEAVGEETLRAGGLRIYTTLDLNLQRAAEGQVRRHLATLAESEPGEPAHNVHNAAVVALDPRSGAVRVLVGSPDYFDAAIDGAVNAAVAPRQSGSAIKPLTYAAAFERGYSPASMVVDVSTTFTTREGRPYTPVNYDYREHGPVLLRQALGSSYNIVAVKLLDRIGIAALVDLAGRLGLPELGREDCQGLAMTLGSCEVPLTRLTAAYAALANGGDRVTPQYIERVETADGEVLWSATPTRTPVLDSRVAYLITDILADDDARAPTFGRNSVLRLPLPRRSRRAPPPIGGTTGPWAIPPRSWWACGWAMPTTRPWSRSPG
jgi:membrane peptidoglycan carboxypeptidase